MGRASNRKRTAEHLDEMAARAARRDLRRRRRLGLLAKQAEARHRAKQLNEFFAKQDAFLRGEGERPVYPEASASSASS